MSGLNASLFKFGQLKIGNEQRRGKSNARLLMLTKFGECSSVKLLRLGKEGASDTHWISPSSSVNNSLIPSHTCTDNSVREGRCITQERLDNLRHSFIVRSCRLQKTVEAPHPSKQCSLNSEDDPSQDAGDQCHFHSWLSHRAVNMNRLLALARIHCFCNLKHHMKVIPSHTIFLNICAMLVILKVVAEHLVTLHTVLMLWCSLSMYSIPLVLSRHLDICQEPAGSAILRPIHQVLCDPTTNADRSKIADFASLSSQMVELRFPSLKCWGTAD